MSAPTAKQCAARALPAHAAVLRRLLVDEPAWIDDVCSAADARGRRTVLATLHRWGAVDDAGITEFGRAVLSAIDQRTARRSIADLRDRRRA